MICTKGQFGLLIRTYTHTYIHAHIHTHKINTHMYTCSDMWKHTPNSWFARRDSLAWSYIRTCIYTYTHEQTHMYIWSNMWKHHEVMCENTYLILDLREGKVLPPPLPILAPVSHRYDMFECEFKDCMDTCACLFKDHMDIGIWCECEFKDYMDRCKWLFMCSV